MMADIKPPTPGVAQKPAVSTPAKPGATPAKPVATAKPAAAVPSADPSKKEGSKTASGTVLFKIRPKASVDELYLKLLIYGNPGSGKTTLCASSVDVPAMRDVLYIDCEKSEMTLDDNTRIENADEIERVRVDSFRAVAQIQEFLKSHCSARDAGDVQRLRKLEANAKQVPIEEIEEPRRYRTLVIDSLSEVNEFAMYHLLNLSTDMKIEMDDMEVAEWAEFRKNNQMMQLLIRAYRDLPMNVLFICSSQYTQDELKRRFFAPNLTGKLSGQVMGFMDVVGYLQTGKVKEGETEAGRRLWIQPVGGFEAKNRRSYYKGAFFENPTMRTIMKGFGFNQS